MGDETGSLCFAFWRHLASFPLQVDQCVKITSGIMSSTSNGLPKVTSRARTSLEVCDLHICNSTFGAVIYSVIFSWTTYDSWVSYQYGYLSVQSSDTSDCSKICLMPQKNKWIKTTLQNNIWALPANILFHGLSEKKISSQNICTSVFIRNQADPSILGNATSPYCKKMGNGFRKGRHGEILKISWHRRVKTHYDEYNFTVNKNIF